MLSLNWLFGPVLGVLAAGRLLLPPGGWEGHAPPFRHVTDIAVSAKNGLVVYATADDAFQDADGLWHYPSAVFRTADGGSTWTTLDVSIPATITTDATGAVYAVASDRILRSTDHGASWTRIMDAPTGCPSIMALAADPADSGILYVGTGRNFFGRFECGGVYKSLDGGHTLTRTPLPDQFVTGVTLDATDSSIVYTCSVYSGGFFSGPALVSRSLDAGQSWNAFSQGARPHSFHAGTASLWFGAGRFRPSIDSRDPRCAAPGAVSDQSRAIDNARFVRILRPLPRSLLREVEEKLRRLGEP